MRGIDGLFLRTAVVYVIAGMALGIFMAISEDHSQTPTHAHMNLLGWASMALYAVVYRVWPEAARSPLAAWHFWIANLGTLVLLIGVAGIMAGHEESFGPVAAAGSILSLIGTLVFAVIIYTRIGVDRARSPGTEPLGAG
ncbi:MAG TPA: cytochrome-c oxidase [Stellaceae bacterium]|nr:cytochrome-c oxidase [Stellaceae bacterium]